jgi:hypothetical protein
MKKALLSFVILITSSCGGGSSSDSPAVASSPPPAAAANRTPIANAGSAQVVRPYIDTVSLDASGSSDPDGDALSYSWAIDTKPEVSDLTLSAPTTAQQSFVPDAVGKYVFSVRVTDGRGGTSSAVVEVNAEFGKTYSVAEARALYNSANPQDLDAAIEFGRRNGFNSFHIDFFANRAPGTTIFHSLEKNLNYLPGGATVNDFSFNFQNVVAVPSDLNVVNYPADYTRTLNNVTLIDPYCRADGNDTHYPSEYLGAFTLPEIKSTPLGATVSRVIGVKDVWGKPNKEGYSFTPNFVPGCVDDVRVSFKRTITRLKQLKADTVILIPWTFFDGSSEKWRVENPAETLSSTIGDADLRWMVAEARRNDLKVLVSVQIQGARKTKNIGGSSEYYSTADASVERVVKSYDALDEFLAERGKFYQEIGVAGIILGGWYWAGFEGVLDRETYISRTRQKIEQLKKDYRGQVIYYATPSIAEDSATSALIDIFGVSVFNPFTENDLDRLTVDVLQEEYLRQIESISTWVKSKPIMWVIGAPSRADYLYTGYLEETFCTAGFDLDGSRPSNRCIQRDKKVDLGLQAMVYEAQFRAFTSSRGLNVVSVVSTDYWMDSNLLPNVTFPNLAFSVRGKPAEYVVYKWFTQN